MYVLYGIFLPQKFPIFFFLLSCDIYYYESFSSVAIFNTMNFKKKKKKLIVTYTKDLFVYLSLKLIHTRYSFSRMFIVRSLTLFIIINTLLTFGEQAISFFSMERICLQDECMHNPSSNKDFPCQKCNVNFFSFEILFTYVIKFLNFFQTIMPKKKILDSKPD